MMVNKETLEHIAHLARLEVDEQQADRMLEDLNKMVNWVGQLDQVDTTGVAPLIHLSEEINKVREDEVKILLSHEQAMANAPARDSDYFHVPKVLESGE